MEASESDHPAWYIQLMWSPARRIEDVKRFMMPPGSGLYAFTSDTRELRSANALYIGKADGERQTLRGRLGSYISYFANDKAPASKHKGKRLLKIRYLENPGEFFVRWTGVVVARDLEGALIEALDPKFNNKDEHRRGFADEEQFSEAEIAEWFYTWTEEDWTKKRNT